MPEQEKKTYKRKNPARRLPASTEGTRKRFIFESICIALAQENWEGATMLMLLHENKGKLKDFQPVFEKLIAMKKGFGK